MKKKHITIMVSGLALLLCCSCSKQEGAASGSALPDLIRITAGTDVAVETKAAITDGTFPTTRTMYVSAYHGASNQNHFTSALFSYSSGAWLSDKSWPLSGTLDFLAYSAGALSVTDVAWGSSDATESVRMTVPDNASAQEDILVGCAASQSSGTAVVIDFRHPQAYLVFTAKASEAYSSTTNRGVTLSGLTLMSAKYSGTLLASRTGSDLSFFWNSLGSPRALALPGVSPVDLTTSAASVGTGILLPEQGEVGFTLSYTLHNGKDSSGNAVDAEMTYDYTPTSPGTWEAGKKYGYVIDITTSGVTVTPTVALWTAGTDREVTL